MRKINIMVVDQEETSPEVDFPMMEGIHRDLFKGYFEHKIIFYAGIENIIPGVGEIWILFKEPAIEWPGAFNAIKRLFDMVFNDYPYHRLQSHVIVDSVSVGFNKHLGMEIEGTMRKYAYGKDYHIMARVS